MKLKNMNTVDPDEIMNEMVNQATAIKRKSHNERDDDGRKVDVKRNLHYNSTHNRILYRSARENREREKNYIL